MLGKVMVGFFIFFFCYLQKVNSFFLFIFYRWSKSIGYRYWWC